MVSGSSSSGPLKFRWRRRRSSSHSFSGAWSRAATTARQAGSVAATAGLTASVIGIPCRSASFPDDRATFSAVSPLAA